MNIKVGDLVQIKSGGPSMTVSETFSSGEDQTVTCTWYTGEDRNSEEFSAAMLKPVTVKQNF